MARLSRRRRISRRATGKRGPKIARQLPPGGRAELLADEPPWAVLAVPLANCDGTRHIALAAFFTGALGDGADAATAAVFRGAAAAEMTEWARRQTPWPAENLLRTARLCRSRFAQAERLRKKEREVESLSSNLSSTYEEISLLYRLTQNLKLSRSDEAPARVALEWMSEVVPAQGLAILLLPRAGAKDSPSHHRSQPTLVAHGDVPLDAGGFAWLVDHLALDPKSGPAVINRAVTGDDAWPLIDLRETIVVPMAEGENLFGWLGAFNHAAGGEFGTVEANLIHSVAAILGIHSGNVELYRQQAELMAGIIRALTSAIDAKDPYTCGHSDRVARIAVRLAREMDCSDDMLESIYLSGLLHDIGKIGISDAVLRKPGQLTDEEFAHIQTHPSVGHRILVDLRKLDEVLPVVLHHHESWDGRGYPEWPSRDGDPLLGTRGGCGRRLRRDGEQSPLSPRDARREDRPHLPRGRRQAVGPGDRGRLLPGAATCARSRKSRSNGGATRREGGGQVHVFGQRFCR